MSDLLEPHIAALVRAERAHPDPSASAKARVLARVQTTTGAVPSPSSAPPNAASASSGVLLRASLGSLVAAAAVGSFLALRATSPSIPPAGRSAPRGAAIALESGASAVPSATAPPEIAVTEPPSLPVAAPPVSARAGPVATASPSGATAFAAERPLLERARTALLNGNPASALTAIGVHARRFPHGVLAEECDALRVEALVADHRYNDARTAASRFHATYPGSMLTAAVDAALEAIP